ncbi:MAG: ACT domain-containing protein [Prevotella sp.]|nr:ACT domain-containing protein [Alistipes senegalensis]MCM1357469.1 ACT domain-containing protein [Prevotella sp.]MCM1473015.1 ACT domain-containing protein [Muribaculaceae bacterium]MDE5557914.1 ACT domain-containing protein [Ruminococcus sp.]MDE6426478.1 ACT domain-containing protein [Ruminococcus sp.]
MRAVITVIGKDNVGILHKVSGICAEYNANVLEVTQSVLQDMFAMIMLADITEMSGDFSALVDRMDSLGKELNLSIHTMHEDIFNSMHSI